MKPAVFFFKCEECEHEWTERSHGDYVSESICPNYKKNSCNANWEQQPHSSEPIKQPKLKLVKG